jgi:hypothetical protein
LLIGKRPASPFPDETLDGSAARLGGAVPNLIDRMPQK